MASVSLVTDKLCEILNPQQARVMGLGAAEFNDSASYLEGCGVGPHRFGPGKFSEMCATLHYWSPHPGRANFAMADGSVRLIAYDGAEILPKLATRAGGE